MKRSLLLWVAPVYLLLVATLWPVISGEQTFFLRDAFNAHLELKAAEARALGEGRLPLVAPELGGGQPLLGNLNAVPLYPDNLLYRALPLLAAFNAHFWLHWLLAPLAMAWLARRWGIGRRGAWTAGVVYATGGYFASLLNFYNLVAGGALAPALAAAALELAEPRPGHRRWPLAVCGALWCLLLLAGGPVTAAAAAAMALGGVALRHGRRALRPAVWWPQLAAFAGGTLLAAPQLIETLRILPLSYRGHQGYSESARSIGSLHPGQLGELLLPFAFGRPSQMREGGFWGYELYGGDPPILFTLYPGLLALLLAALALWGPRGDGAEPLLAARRAGLVFAGIGLFFALGAFNPVWPLLQLLPGASLLRYPVKLWLPVAVGLALLAGVGMERLLAGARDRPAARLKIGLTALAALYLAVWAWLSFAPGAATALLRRLVPASFGAAFVDHERLRWAGLALLTAVLLVALLAATALLRRRPALGGALLLALHAGGQLFFLRPALATDAAEPYLEPPPLLALLPAEARVVHGTPGGLFGRYDLRRGSYPAPTAQWIERRIFRDLHPVAGVLHGRRYELNLSPEGLGSFLTRAAQDAVERSPDAERLRLLAAWGVERLLLHRPLAPGAAARELATQPGFGGMLYLYAVEGATPEVFFAARLSTAGDLGRAIERLTAEDFDPRREVVLAGAGSAVAPETGEGDVEVEILRLDDERLEVRVETPAAGALVWQRAWLPLYRATVDGEPATVEVANLHRMAIRLPPGEHRVVIATDRRPLALGFALSLAGLALLLVLAARPPRSRATLLR